MRDAKKASGAACAGRVAWHTHRVPVRWRHDRLGLQCLLVVEFEQR